MMQFRKPIQKTLGALSAYRPIYNSYFFLHQYSQCLMAKNQLKQKVSFVTSTTSGQGLTWMSLPDRGILRLQGPQALEFLQGLTTNDLKPLQNDIDSVYTVFLNMKGRVVADAHIYKMHDTSDSYLVDVHKSQARALYKHMKKFKLASKFTLEDLSKYSSVAAILPSGRVGTNQLSNDSIQVIQDTIKSHPTVDTERFIFRDKRCPTIGARSIVLNNQEELDAPAGNIMTHLSHEMFDSLSVSSQNALADPQAYHLVRWLLGIPEGPEVENTIALEWNLTFLNGISFTKGCYLGQELMARTHFKGKIRKRVVPVLLYQQAHSVDSKIPSLLHWDTENTQFQTDISNINLGAIAIPQIDGLKTLIDNKNLTSIDSLNSNASNNVHSYNQQVTDETTSNTIHTISTAKKAGKLLSQFSFVNAGFANLRFQHSPVCARLKDEVCEYTDADDTTDLVVTTGNTSSTFVSQFVVPVLPLWWDKVVKAYRSQE